MKAAKRVNTKAKPAQRSASMRAKGRRPSIKAAGPSETHVPEALQTPMDSEEDKASRKEVVLRDQDLELDA